MVGSGKQAVSRPEGLRVSACSWRGVQPAPPNQLEPRGGVWGGTKSGGTVPPVQKVVVLVRLVPYVRLRLGRGLSPYEVLRVFRCMTTSSLDNSNSEQQQRTVADCPSLSYI